MKKFAKNFYKISYIFIVSISFSFCSISNAKIIASENNIKTNKVSQKQKKTSQNQKKNLKKQKKISKKAKRQKRKEKKTALKQKLTSRKVKSIQTKASSCGFDDWVVLPECYELGNKKCKKLCRGYYLEPEYPFPEYGYNVPNQPIEITADEASFVEKGTSIFKGHVVAKEGNKSIYSDKAYIVHNEKTGDLEKIHSIGNVKITIPGQKICGSEAYYLYQKDEKIIKDAKFRIYDRHVRGTSKELKASGKNLMFLPDATYTTCAPNDTVWKLKAKKVKLNKETGRGEAWHSRLHVKDVPVFYWPYVNFPIDDRRKTGFLQPLFSQSQSYGPTLILPFYWNMAPNYDATITPYFSAKRKLRLLNEVRYLTSSSNGIIKFDYLPHDNEYTWFRDYNLYDPGDVPLNSRRIAGLKDISKRYAYSIKHDTSFTRDFIFEIDYSKIGDDNYIHDIGPEVIQNQQFINTSFAANNALLPKTNTSTQNDTTNAVLQKMMLKYRSRFGTLSYLLQQYQILHPFEGNRDGTEQYQKLPQINFNSASFDLFNGVKWIFNTHHTHYKIKDVPFIERRTFGKRFFIKPQIYKDFGDGGWFVKPSAKIRHVNYDLNLSTTDRNLNRPNSPKKTIPILDLDSGLIFERDLQIKDTDYIQTLEPRAYFLFAPNKEQDHLPLFDTRPYLFDYNQLFRDNRYYGHDRVSEASQVSLALSTKFLTDANNIEKANFSIGQIVYFRDRIQRYRLNERINNNTKRSPIAMILNYKICKDWNVLSNFVWDKPEKKINNATLTFQYKPYKYNVFNVGYSFVRDFRDTIDYVTGRKRHLRQTNISTAWVLSRHIRAIGKIEYDLQRKNIINTLGGFEFYGCCTNFRLVAMRTRTAIKSITSPRKYESSIGFQLVFKGLGGTGSISHATIASTIPGYEAPSDNEF